MQAIKPIIYTEADVIHIAISLKPLRSMWPLHPGFNNQYRLVFTLCIIGWKVVDDSKSYYKSSSVCLFVCLSVCLFVPYLLRGPLTDLRQTWWVYVGGPRNCPWGVLFRKGQRLDGSTGHFHFPLYYICASLTPHSCKRRLCCYCI